MFAYGAVDDVDDIDDMFHDDVDNEDEAIQSGLSSAKFRANASELPANGISLR